MAKPRMRLIVSSSSLYLIISFSSTMDVRAQWSPATPYRFRGSFILREINTITGCPAPELW
jgi:hypothetical protein